MFVTLVKSPVFLIDADVEKSRKLLVKEALPTLNFPGKRHGTVNLAEVARKPATSRVDTITKPAKYCYKSFSELYKRVQQLKSLNRWKIDYHEGRIIIAYLEQNHVLPKYKLTLKESLDFDIQIYEWFLPEDHALYKFYKYSLRNVTVTDLISSCKTFEICPGTNSKELYGDLILHSIPIHCNHQSHDSEDENPPIPYQSYTKTRHSSCELLVKNQLACIACKNFDKKFNRDTQKKQKVQNTAAKKKSPISITNPQRMKLTLREQRLKCNQLQEEICHEKRNK